MTSVGEILRHEREAQGRGMSEIAEELCITQRYLRAIEDDDLKSLPGMFFYKSFVKQYAAILNVKEQEIQAAVDELTAAQEPLPLPGAEPAPAIRHVDPIVADANRRYFPDRRIALPVVGFTAVLLLCSGFYAWWNKTSHSITEGTKTATEKPIQMSAAPAVPTTPVSVAVQSPGEAPHVDVTTTTGPDGVNHVVLNISATEKTWLSITSEGKQLFSGILQPSESKTLTAAEMAKLKVGNAGGLEIRWNGKQIGPIGPRGQVRTVLFTPENFQIITPDKASL